MLRSTMLNDIGLKRWLRLNKPLYMQETDFFDRTRHSVLRLYISLYIRLTKIKFSALVLLSMHSFLLSIHMKYNWAYYFYIII